MLSCILSWSIIIAGFLLMLKVHAAGYEKGSNLGGRMTLQELHEEAYYDSLELLAVCVEAEAGNQSLIGKRMVADVVLNRVDDPDWPDTITEVITEPRAFSSYWNGAMDKVWEPSEETFLAVTMELETRTWPNLYYFTSNGFSKYGTPWKKVGDHYFSEK